MKIRFPHTTPYELFDNDLNKENNTIDLIEHNSQMEIEIRGNTFQDCVSLVSIDIPEGVTRIGGHAFHGCTSLSRVIVPKTVREIGSSAFRGCSSLRTISIPSGASVNERAFKESPTSITRY